MKFECGDLERALAVAELMPEAREHLKTCAACRREYWLWTEISSQAKTLREEWDSPHLWPKIRESLASEQKPVPWWQQRKVWAVAATALAAAALSLTLWRVSGSHAPQRPLQSSTRAATKDFLTEQTLLEVEKNEAAYRQSIDKLSRLAAPELEKTGSAAVASAREKLVMLDSAIVDTRASVAMNRYNLRLQTTLADLYREKQQTLEELVTREHKN